MAVVLPALLAIYLETGMVYTPMSFGSGAVSADAVDFILGLHFCSVQSGKKLTITDGVASSLNFLNSAGTGMALACWNTMVQALWQVRVILRFRCARSTLARTHPTLRRLVRVAPPPRTLARRRPPSASRARRLRVRTPTLRRLVRVAPPAHARARPLSFARWPAPARTASSPSQLIVMLTRAPSHPSGGRSRHARFVCSVCVPLRLLQHDPASPRVQ